MDSVHVGLNPRDVSGDSGVHAGLLFLCTAVSPADDPIEHHPAVGRAGEGTT